MLATLLCCMVLAADPQAKADVPSADTQPKVSWGLRTISLDDGKAVLVKAYGRALPMTSGVIVSSVIDEGPAAMAGIKPGDVIAKVDDQAIKTRDELAKVFRDSKKDQLLRISLWRLEPTQFSARATAQARAKNPTTWSRKTVQIVVVEWTEELAARADRPIKITGAVISHNVIGEPVLVVDVIARKAIEAYEIGAEAVDKFGDPVKNWGFGGNAHTALSQSSMTAGESSSDRWTMHGSEGVGVFHCRLLRVKLKDGTVWKPPEGQSIVFDAELAKN